MESFPALSSSPGILEPCHLWVYALCQAALTCLSPKPAHVRDTRHTHPGAGQTLELGSESDRALPWGSGDGGRGRQAGSLINKPHAMWADVCLVEQ